MFASLVAIGSAAVFSLPFLLPTAFVFSPLVGVIAAYGYLKSRSPQQKLLQGPSSSAGRRPWQPSPGVPGRHLQEKQAALLPQPASTSMDVQRIPRVTRASETAAGGERNEESGPGSRAGGFGETQARERTNLDAARRFPPPQLAYPLPAPFQAAPPQAAPPQAAPSQAAPPQAAPPQAAPQLAAPHVAPTPPAGIRARPSSPESVHVAGYPKARAVAGLGSLEGPAEAVRPTELTGAARVRGVEAGKTGEIGGAEEAGKTGATGGAGGEVPEEAAAAGVAGQEGGKPEAEVEEKRVVDVQGGEGSEEDQLLMEKEVHEEGVRVASEIKKLEKVLAGRTIQSPGSPREEAELLCGLLGVTPPPPLSPQPRFPRQARASRKQTVEGQLWEVRRASQLVEVTKEELGVA
ncbi:unnamed protein product [Closterium sp. NIES-65]|nr:unnamed protein product [Closterium sp. NIES-65]